MEEVHSEYFLCSSATSIVPRDCIHMVDLFREALSKAMYVNILVVLIFVVGLLEPFVSLFTDLNPLPFASISSSRGNNKISTPSDPKPINFDSFTTFDDLEDIHSETEDIATEVS